MRPIRKDEKIAFAFLFVTLAALLGSCFLTFRFIRFVAAGILVISAVTAILFVKKRRILSFNKRQMLVLISAFAAVFLMLYYISGIFYGYYKSIYPFSFDTCWRYILPILTIIVASEILRHVIFDLESRFAPVFTYIICVLADVAIENGFLYLDNINSFMEFVGMTLFHSITANILLHYVSKRYGMWSGIVYRSILYLYMFIIPYIPNTPQILPSFILLIMPIVALLFIRALYQKRKKVATHKKSKWSLVSGGIVLVILTAFVMLISCQFRYGILVIATNSMQGEINRGDGVVFEAYENQTIQEGDIIVYTNQETTIVHRVVAIQQSGSETRYFTKGDANEDMDISYVTKNDIVGIVQFKVVYIGYPSLWLRELFD